MGYESIEVCPICDSLILDPFLICTDFTTTKEKFHLKKCRNCSFVITSPRPDHNSLGKYYDSENYISHTGGSSAILDAVYLFVRRFTIRWKTRLVRRHKQPISILDYGCGTGEFLKAAVDLGWDAVGVEPSEQANTKATTLTNLNVKQNLSELDAQKFDVITLWHVLEHVPNPKETLSRLKHLLKDDGILFVAVPNHESYDAQVYREFWAGYDVPRHFWHFTRKTMLNLVERTGFTLKQIEPMKLDAFYVSLLSQKYKSGTNTVTGILRGLATGLTSNLKATRTDNYSSLIYIATPCV